MWKVIFIYHKLITNYNWILLLKPKAKQMRELKSVVSVIRGIFETIRGFPILVLDLAESDELD